MTVTESERLEADVKVEEVGPAARRLTISVGPETISEKLDEAMSTLAVETSLPGFRKGRAPRELLERRFGDALRNETKSQIVASAYATAIEDHGIKPVGEPVPVEDMADLKLEKGQAMTFSVDVEVMPEFELPSLEGIEVKKPVLDIADEHIEEELSRYKRHLGETVRIDGDFQAADRVTCTAVVTRNDETEPFFRHEQVVIVHPGDAEGGRGQVLGLLIDGLAGMLDGKRITDVLTIDAKGPESHEREDIRGADLHMELEINQAERLKPATIETVIETLGLGTEEILREQIKLVLEQRRDEEQAAAMRQQVGEALMSATDFELPSRLSEQQISRTLERQRLQMLYAGMPPDDVETRLAELRADSEAETRMRLKQFFLLRKLADHFEVAVSQAEVNGRVASMAAQRGVRPDALMQEISQSGQIGEITNQIREDKALDRVVAQAKVSEITAEEWRKLVAGAGDGNTGASTTTTKKKKKTTSKKKTTRKKTAAKD